MAAIQLFEFLPQLILPGPRVMIFEAFWITGTSGSMHARTSSSPTAVSRKGQRRESTKFSTALVQPCSTGKPTSWEGAQFLTGWKMLLVARAGECFCSHATISFKERRSKRGRGIMSSSKPGFSCRQREAIACSSSEKMELRCRPTLEAWSTNRSQTKALRNE